MPEQHDFNQDLKQLAYAFGKPVCSGVLKQRTEDFKVTEIMQVELSGDGEHFWLDITKTGLSTERVAKALARHSGVAYRDVGYAGMKDVQAVTRQWFSVWMPKQLDFDWSEFIAEQANQGLNEKGAITNGIKVHSVQKHSRKLKRGAHTGNGFEIRIRDLLGDLGDLPLRVQKIRQHGVPNYFGEQRFGRDAGNLLKAERFFGAGQRIKDRNLRSIVLSSARSYLFNLIVSARIEQGSWCELHSNEPAALNGSNAVFASDNEDDNSQRLEALDIHPTAPLWGRGAGRATELYQGLADWEHATIEHASDFKAGLEANGLEYARRAARSVPAEFSFELDGDDAVVKFSLQAGHFATSVLRELIATSHVSERNHA